MLVLVLLIPTACGEVNDPSTAGTYDAADPTGDATMLGTVLTGGEGEPLPLGKMRAWDASLQLRVGSAEVGGDAHGPWLKVSLHAENSGAKARTLPTLGLTCDGSGGRGTILPDDEAAPSTVAAHQSVDLSVRLLLPGDQRVGDYRVLPPIPACVGSASIDLEEYLGDGAVSMGPGWALPGDVLDQLNAARSDRTSPPTPTEPAVDPSRPYAWVDEALPDGFQVVVVPGMTAEQAIGVLRPVRGATSEEYERVAVIERPEGVVIFTTWFVAERHLRALSRGGRLAASYSNTVEGDDHVLVARDGKVVRSFDPFTGDAYDRSAPLPQEKGLDLEDDTWAASFTLLERLTGVPIAEGWLQDDANPGFRLRD